MDIYSSVTQKQVLKKSKNFKKGEEKNKDVKKSSKKVVHDLFVQGTNDSSIVSKRSVEILYREKVDGESTKPYFQHFVKKSPRRTPVINRGYWIRMKSIRMSIEKIIEQQPINQRINIINLGCGYDPLPFQLLDDEKFKNRKIFCIDVDFPELIGYKSEMIKMAPDLMDLIGDMKSSPTPGIVIQTDSYATMGCDLTDKELYIQQLNSFMANSPSTTNIFIAEVSLAYMTPKTANSIIETSSSFINSHFIILEQLMPAGEDHPFANRMINHFKKMEAPLQCVHTYPTIDKQIERFEGLGYKHVNARDLIGCWDIVSNDVKLKVESVEAFDEWEEFIFFGQHYINLHATNQDNVEVYADEYNQLYEDIECNENSKYQFSTQNLITPGLQRKFHSCLTNTESSFITCGTNQSRLNDILQLNSTPKTDKYMIRPSNPFKPKVGTTSVSIGPDSYLIGGRRIPGIGINEFWKLENSKENHLEFNWKQLPDMPQSRVKHTSIEYNSGILVYGGLSDEGFSYYNTKTNIWIDLSCESKVNLSSAKMIKLERTDEVYLIGGMINDKYGNFDFNTNLYQVSINLNQEIVDLKPIFSHKCLARYGFNIYSNGVTVLIIGGVGKKLYDQKDTIVELTIENDIKVKSVKIDSDIWKQHPVLIGTDILIGEEQLWTVAGGAVCYGFGSVWGDILGIGINKKPDDLYV